MKKDLRMAYSGGRYNTTSENGNSPSQIIFSGDQVSTKEFGIIKTVNGFDHILIEFIFFRGQEYARVKPAVSYFRRSVV